MNNNQSLYEKLAMVAKRVLEDAAFVIVEYLHNNNACPPRMTGWRAEGVSLSFRGAASGTVHMWADEGFAGYAASNMLGMEPDVDDAVRRGLDAFKEILNIIVGNFLTEVYGSAPAFDLGLPEPLSLATLDTDLTAADAVWLEAEGRVLMLRVCIDDRDE